MSLEENKLRQIEEIEALCAIFENLVKIVDDRKFAGTGTFPRDVGSTSRLLVLQCCTGCFNMLYTPWPEIYFRGESGLCLNFK
jgi:hypothetical protein